MSNIRTIADYSSTQVYVPENVYDNDIKKLTCIAKDLNKKYLAAKKEKIQDNMLIERLATELRAANRKINELSNQPKIKIGGSNGRNIFAEANEYLKKESGISPDELIKMEQNVEEIMKKLLN